MAEGISDRLTTAEASVYLGVSAHTLSQWRGYGRGPAYVKYGNKVWYLLADLEAWVASQRVVPADEQRPTDER